MRISSRLLALLIVLIGLSGCHETDYEFWINPDGSGKVKITSAIHYNMPFEQQELSLEYRLLQTVYSHLAFNENIAFWKDVAYEWRPDGKIQLTGEAYFDDVSKIRFHNIEYPFRIQVNQQPNGKLVYEFKLDKQNVFYRQNDERAPQSKDVSQWSEDELKEKILLNRVEYLSLRKLYAYSFGDSHGKIHIHVPGTIEIISKQLQQEDAQTLSIEWDGGEWVQQFDDWSQDDASIRTMILNKTNLRQSIRSPEFIRTVLFGQPDPIQAQVQSNGSGFFNFKQAVDEYQPAFQQMIEQLKLKEQQLNPWYAELPTPIPTPLPTPTPGPFVEGDNFSSLEIIGVRHIKGDNIDIHTLGRQAYKSTFSLGIKAMLPGVVDHFDEGRIEKAETFEGENLIADTQFFGAIQNILLSEQNRVVSFDLHMAEPSPDAKGIKVISGYIQNFLPGEVKEITLAQKELVQGQSWDQLNTQIVYLGNSKRLPNSFEIHIQVSENSLSIKSAKLIDENGVSLPMWPSRRDEKTSQVTLRFFCKTAPPKKASIVFEVIDEYRFGKVPFKIENIDLLGKPLNQ